MTCRKIDLTVQLPTVLIHSNVIKPDAFSEFVFSFRQICISKDLDIRFLMPLLRSPQTEIIHSTNARNASAATVSQLGPIGLRQG